MSWLPLTTTGFANFGATAIGRRASMSSLRVRAAAARLEEAHRQAISETVADYQWSSVSSATINPGRVPFTFSWLPNLEATYYARLEIALLPVLGDHPSTSLFGDD